MKHVISAVLLLGLVAGAPAGDPPSPNLEQPVDYAAWFDKEYGSRIRQNAAEKYREASDAYVFQEQAYNTARNRFGRNWTAAERRAIREWIEQNESAIAHFRAASNVRRCYFGVTVDSDGAVNASVADFRGIRSLVAVVSARARLRALGGELSGAADDVACILRASRHLQQQPTALPYLAAIAIQTRAYDVVQELPVLAGKEPDYALLLKMLRGADRNPVPLRKALEGELAYFCDYVQHHGKDADGDGRIEHLTILNPGAIAAGKTEDEQVAVDPPIAATALAEQYQAYLDIVFRMERLRYPEAQKLSKECDDLRSTSAALRVLVPGFWRAEQLRRARDAERNAARAILRIHAWRAAHGEWPAALAEAMKGESPTLGWDPFSDGELVYKLKGGEPLLYSVGADGKDDRGRPRENDRIGEKGDIVFWPLPRD